MMWIFMLVVGLAVALIKLGLNPHGFPKQDDINILT